MGNVKCFWWARGSWSLGKGPGWLGYPGGTYLRRLGRSWGGRGSQRLRGTLAECQGGGGPGGRGLEGLSEPAEGLEEGLGAGLGAGRGRPPATDRPSPPSPPHCPRAAGRASSPSPGATLSGAAEHTRCGS